MPAEPTRREGARFICEVPPGYENANMVLTLDNHIVLTVAGRMPALYIEALNTWEIATLSPATPQP